jgi:type VI secretion system protein VasD
VIRRRAVLAAPAGFTATLALARCAAPPPPPAVLELVIAAGRDQNPNPSSQPAAVKLYLYQLSATGKFESADVFALVERASATLGQDMMALEDISVAPGETRTLERQLKHDVQFLGVIALFRDIDRAKWRAVAPVAASGPTRLTLKTAAITVTLAPTPSMMLRYRNAYRTPSTNRQLSTYVMKHAQ